ncbi:hypothetical protein AAFN46_07505 [Pseudomonas sp. CAU 1711]|uniref:hypothetical protein n=1 Tax=Pseudomonas sp. CAU 1711 TaxID=3140356 RepID=UPI003260B0C6
MSGYPLLPKMRAVLLCLVCLGCMSAVASETVDWYVWPIPGVVNVEHGEPTDGLAMEVLAQVLEHLPMSARFHLGNRARLQQDMAQGVSLCSLPLLPEARSDAIGYFIPLFASTPIQVVVRQSQLAEFPIAQGQLSLADLLADPALRGGLAKARTYPAKLQQQIEEGVRQGRIQRIATAMSGDNLLLMLAHGRFDFALEYASIIQALRSRQSSGEPLVSVPIREDRELSSIGIYCTRNAWGRQLALQLDAAIRQAFADPARVLALHAKWLPAESYQVYLGDFEAFYRQRAQRPLELLPD